MKMSGPIHKEKNDGGKFETAHKQPCGQKKTQRERERRR